jgi:hypothetical protein
MLREKHKWKPHKCQSTNAEHRGGATRSSDEDSVTGLERRGSIVQLELKKTSIRIRYLIFWAIRFAPDDQRTVLVNTLSTSAQRSVIKQRRLFGVNPEGGVGQNVAIKA